MPGWMKHKLESRLPEISTTLDMQMTCKAENEEPLDERGNEKVGLKQHSEN